MIITIEVHARPPAKDGGSSIFNPDHDHYPRVVALRTAVAEQVTEAQRFKDGVPLRLDMIYYRSYDGPDMGNCDLSDSLNLINGVADAIQSRGHDNQPWAIDDDKNIKAFTYFECPAETPWYQIIITPLGDQAVQ